MFFHILRTWMCTEEVDVSSSCLPLLWGRIFSRGHGPLVQAASAGRKRAWGSGCCLPAVPEPTSSLQWEILICRAPILFHLSSLKRKTASQLVQQATFVSNYSQHIVENCDKYYWSVILLTCRYRLILRITDQSRQFKNSFQFIAFVHRIDCLQFLSSHHFSAYRLWIEVSLCCITGRFPRMQLPVRNSSGICYLRKCRTLPPPIRINASL